MNLNYQWHQGVDAVSLAEHLAGEIALKINQAIISNGRAVIAFSGGSTPKPMFQALAKHDIAWSKVVLTLVDERWVDESHELSNGAFLKTHLIDLIDGEKPIFCPLYQPADSVEESCENVLKHYCELTESQQSSPRSFDLVVLGMGSDGHTASFFPDASNIEDLIDPQSEQVLLTCASPTTKVSRITWSVPMLLASPCLVLHITGHTKAEVFQQACDNSDVKTLPIRSMLFQDKTEVQVYYAD